MFRSRLLKSWLRLCDWPRPCSVPSMNPRWDMFHIAFLLNQKEELIYIRSPSFQYRLWILDRATKRRNSSMKYTSERRESGVDVFIKINHCRGSITFWCGSGSQSAFCTSDSWIRIWIRIRLLFSVTLRMQKTYFIFFAYNLPACTVSFVFFWKFSFLLKFCVQILFCKQYFGLRSGSGCGSRSTNTAINTKHKKL